MIRMHIAKLVALTAVVATAVSCGDVVRQGRSPVLLEMVSLTADGGGTLNSDVLSDTGTIFDDKAEAVVQVALKNVGSTLNPVAASSNNDVTINRLHVVFRRADGRNTPGADVPYAFDGAVTGTVAVGAKLSLDFELVRHAAKLESPLVQLSRTLTVITTLADVTFYGRDQVGNDVQVTGTIQVNFGDFAG